MEIRIQFNMNSTGEFVSYNEVSNLFYQSGLENPTMKVSVRPIQFAHLPTPVESLPKLSRELGITSIMIKRDDQTGLAFGGNKTRKLEYLLGDAEERGARTLITRGAAQSNHCRQTAAAAARHGFDCCLVLTGENPNQLNGNLLLDKILGARLVWSRDQDPEKVLETEYKNLQDQGKDPYLIPYGGSNEIGVFAYVEAMRELLDQETNLDRIILATSSGGTQAGICLGAAIHGFDGEITGISVDLKSSTIQSKVASLVNQTSRWLGTKNRSSEQEIHVVDEFLGEGYGIVGQLELDAIQTFAKLEGILLDPVYTGRAAGGMIELIRKGMIKETERVLFWHTGGTPSLFAYAETLIK
jgi:D-cysteine desulfhydrase family pyridoxal phosphate-dependent enzyme